MGGMEQVGKEEFRNNSGERDLSSEGGSRSMQHKLVWQRWNCRYNGCEYAIVCF